MGANGEEPTLKSGQELQPSVPPLSLEELVREMIEQQRSVLIIAGSLVDLCGVIIQRHGLVDEELEANTRFLNGEPKPL